MKYFRSFTNKLQLLTHFIIAYPFALCQVYYQLSQIESSTFADIYFCLGAFCTISTTGYLLPIIKDVLEDIRDFLIFLWGLSIWLYMCIFTLSLNKNLMITIQFGRAFVSTYFVLYGDNGYDTFTSDKDGTVVLSQSRKVVGVILRMCQCVVMVVLLLNLLLAIMNKTVDRNWEKLYIRAMTSCANALYRIESVVGDWYILIPIYQENNKEKLKDRIDVLTREMKEIASPKANEQNT
ncbi:hypothetical protein THRCLA_07225 [Thraustotheca clavata]|uniref:Uncharacterized protein n=1 Tax=Thraustotheca clavata TaxID=74557 RepID=A0A1V9ZF44_9STRA|nr:hypothetical protein THRCLA_07225 [Thraustotheca clavata]